ncbi:DUF4241 domain-containing protein [uncultured Microbacterium sp.]|uniref:DUF4241 domain-containing protein n=1 Tax=uncultured Microbacterium sp. TaxID=191216 RepID=UPI0025EA65A2|nr:DUF4241 domain-containing protein [uncultured Microbacterium sp.]
MWGNRGAKAAEKRVQRFLEDYDARWRRAAPAFEDRATRRDAFAEWRDLTIPLMRDHVGGDRLRLDSSFGTPPQYGVAVERIVRSEVEGDRAFVLTEVFESPTRQKHEYVLERDGRGWKISAIEQHFDDPRTPFSGAEQAHALAADATPDARLDDVPDEQRGLDEVRNFTERTVVHRRSQESSEVRVSPAGTLVTSSGVLAVLDFGYDNDDARPLARRVAPGSYPVERVTGFGRNAALRVRFSERMPVTWHPADLPSGPGHFFGVDAGSVCIVDLPAYATMSRRAKAAAFTDYMYAPSPSVQEVALGSRDVGIVAESGYGDGQYPVYWGLDETGAVAQLVVDFLVLVTADDEGNWRHL